MSDKYIRQNTYYEVDYSHADDMVRDVINPMTVMLETFHRNGEEMHCALYDEAPDGVYHERKIINANRLRYAVSEGLMWPIGRKRFNAIWDELENK